jgi:hypothetical protein
MKRLLLIFFACAVFAQVEGQSIIRANPFARAQNTSSYEAEYQAVLNAMTTDPSDANKGYQNDMVKSLVDGGYWARMDVLYIFATEVNTASEALINWVNPGTNNATALVTPTWTTLEGYTGDDATDGVTTNYNPSSEAVNISENDVAFGIYVRNDLQDASTELVEAYSETNRYWSARPRNTDNTAAFRVNTNLATAIASQTNSQGLYIATRRASNEQEFYRNGGSLATHTQNSLGLPNANVYLIRYTLYQAAIFFVMDAVSDAEATALNTIFETYMDAIGTGVQ